MLQPPPARWPAARPDRGDRARRRCRPGLPRHAGARHSHGSRRRPLASDRNRAGSLRLVELSAHAARRRGGRGAGHLGPLPLRLARSSGHLAAWLRRWVRPLCRGGRDFGAGGNRPCAALVPDQRDLVLGLGRRHGRALQPKRPRPRRRAQAPAGPRLDRCDRGGLVGRPARPDRPHRSRDQRRAPLESAAEPARRRSPSPSPVRGLGHARRLDLAGAGGPAGLPRRHRRQLLLR